MQSDEEGFLYPCINEVKCIQCGKCVKICPSQNLIGGQLKKYLIAQSKYDDILKNSASGGAFTHLSDRILELHGTVYGACYDGNFSVVHKRTALKSERNLLRDSKYVQSNIEFIFESVLQDLQNGSYVLFSGTPCQCAAIRNYLQVKRINTEKLYIIDIICHGVGSPKIWSEYLNYKKNDCGINTIDSIITRNKKIGHGYNLTFVSNGKYYCKQNVEDPYINLFCKNLIMRPSCYYCHFKSNNRPGDLTIGDFQKAKLFYPNYSLSKGVSLLIINTIKGDNLFASIHEHMKHEYTDYEKAYQVNLSKNVSTDTARNIFFKEYQIHGFLWVLKKYTEVGIVNHLKGEIKRILKAILLKS